MIVIRPFAPEEWERYRELRLSALADSPDSFGSTYALESQRSDEHWQQRLLEAATSTTSLLLVAERGDEAIGLCWGKFDPEAPGVVHVLQMWVAPSSRGRGVASRLLAAVLDWSRDAGAQRAVLNVTCENVAAERIYSRAGFVSTGVVRPLRDGSSVLVQSMSLTLGEQASEVQLP